MLFAPSVLCSSLSTPTFLVPRRFPGPFKFLQLLRLQVSLSSLTPSPFPSLALISHSPNISCRGWWMAFNFILFSFFLPFPFLLYFCVCAPCFVSLTTPPTQRTSRIPLFISSLYFISLLHYSPTVCYVCFTSTSLSATPAVTTTTTHSPSYYYYLLTFLLATLTLYTSSPIPHPSPLSFPSSSLTHTQPY